MIRKWVLVTYKELYLVRCACDRPFIVTRSTIDKAVKNKNKMIACKKCRDRERARLKNKGRKVMEKQKQTKPKTLSAQEAVRRLQELPRDPTFSDMKSIGRATGMYPQSVEKLWLRWIVLPERNHLRQLLAGGQGCNNSCSHARSVPEPSNSRCQKSDD